MDKPRTISIVDYYKGIHRKEIEWYEYRQVYACPLCGWFRHHQMNYCGHCNGKLERLAIRKDYYEEWKKGRNTDGL